MGFGDGKKQEPLVTDPWRAVAAAIVRRYMNAVR